MPSSMSCKLKLTKSVVQISKSDIPKDGMSFQIKSSITGTVSLLCLVSQT